MLKWLMNLLMPAIEGDDIEIVEPDEEPEDAPEDDDEPAPAEDDEPAPEPEDQEPAPAPRLSRAQSAMIKARERAQTAERELAQARAELEMSRRAPAQPATPTQDQVLWQQEEEVLRNPEAQEWQKYAVQANRQSRLANANSQSALRRAEDLADKTAFAALAATKPNVYNKYKDKVEDRLKELRAQGRDAPRESLLALILGQDMLAGKVKTATAKAKSSAAPRASARSDVSASGGGRVSDHEKRMKRLENIRI